DDLTTGLLMRAALEEVGYRVRVARRLSEARAMVRDQAPDLLVLDGLLPDGTGVDFVAELRKSGLQLEVVFLSAFFRDLKSFQKLRQSCGVSDVLHKPVRPDTLVKTVTHLILRSGRTGHSLGHDRGAAVTHPRHPSPA